MQSYSTPEFEISAAARAHVMGAGTRYDRCLHIANFLPQHTVARLHDWLQDEAQWGLRFSDGERILGVHPSTYTSTSGRERRDIASMAYDAARTRFAFLREEVWTQWIDSTLGGETKDSVFAHFLDFVLGNDFTNFVTSVVGCSSIRVVRVSAERYRPGHFYGIAFSPPVGADIGFTFDLTPEWHLEWGGILEFVNATGGVEPAFLPRINAMTLYSLSKPHGVSFVQQFSRASRYSISGQLRVC